MFADIIVDIQAESVDKSFEYKIPRELEGDIEVGTKVIVPFGKGSRKISGFVIALKSESTFDSSKIKEISGLSEDAVSADSEMIKLASFIKENYGGTFAKALKTVLPVRKKTGAVVLRYIYLKAAEDETDRLIKVYETDKRKASRLRLLKELKSERILPYEIVRDKLNISPSVIKAAEKDGIIGIEEQTKLRDVLKIKDKRPYDIVLNPDQAAVADGIWDRFKSGDLRPSLIRGVTGSGKTEIYIELISRMICEGKQAIVLIPEISLTYQTVLRFYRKFGNRISVINSRLTPAQKHDQLEKARLREVDIIIGPRSALFSPFKNLGIIIIDEEHEGSYKNENTPKYHTRETAVFRASLNGAIVVMGSATPSVESYFKAERGIYKLYELNKRARGAELAEVEIVDLRGELARGNRSIISGRLDALIRDRIKKGEQIILFLNRRGYSSFVSCRSCGEALKCPHCDVSLKYHFMPPLKGEGDRRKAVEGFSSSGGKLMCHYCGYEIPMMKTCPSCGSKYIGRFGTGTQKVEEELLRLYPEAKVLRMDLDTTKGKDGHQRILEAFAAHEADILIGTQMIVKGHDFANVTLVGILAADMSLYAGDYSASERTFELLVQAAGRAGRGGRRGNVVIQTYSPQNYAVRLGAAQDYPEFYDYEKNFRKALGYPPFMNMLEVLIQAPDLAILNRYTDELSMILDRWISALPFDGDESFSERAIIKIGPSTAPIGKINDLYRKVIYMKSADYKMLVSAKDLIEKRVLALEDKNLLVTFDFSMMSQAGPGRLCNKLI